MSTYDFLQNRKIIEEILRKRATGNPLCAYSMAPTADIACARESKNGGLISGVVVKFYY